MLNLYTIGFTGKSAETFFKLLRDNGVKKIVDIRLNNTSQLAGFTKGADLKFFTKEIGNIDYEHNANLAPTKEILSQYKDKKITWEEYETAYLNLLNERKIAKKIDFNSLNYSCLLCSEPTPENCHRRLLAEYLKQIKNDVKIIHLIG